MATVDNSQEVLTPILLRSQTPVPGEKVLKYLASMSQEDPDCDPPRSVIESTEYRSNRSTVRSPPLSPQSHPNGNRAVSSHDNDKNGDDIDSNTQEGRMSDIGDMEPNREPGPHDPPGPKYESYDSGPSFGNFGPLPVDDPLSFSIPYTTDSSVHNQDEDMGAVTLNNTLRNPFPASPFGFSPRAPSLGVEGQSNRACSQAGVAMSPKAGIYPMSPRSTARSTSKGLDEEHPMSPLSVKSKTTAKTRATERGMAYHPLPGSRYGDGESNFDIGSPRAHTFSKAPSISPSDSPSNFKPKSASNGFSRSPVVPSATSHQSRPFSPYRHAPTTADLMHAAARNRSLVIPEEDENPPSLHSRPMSVAPSSISKTPSQAPSQSRSKVPSQPFSRALSQASSKASSQAPPQTPQTPSKAPPIAPSTAPSQVPSQFPSQLSKAPSRSSKAPSQSSQAHSQLPSKASSKVPSKAPSQSTAKPSMVNTVRDKGKRPEERTPSPDCLDPEEARIVADALGGVTPRTSYYDQPLEPDVTDHYHDTELCVLLHQEADENLHELVRKALRKAIRQRVKKLGMKYDAESIKQYRKSYHDHDPDLHLPNIQLNTDETPQWAEDLKLNIVLMQQRLESISESIKPHDRSYQSSRFANEGDEFTRTPVTQTVNTQTQHTGALGDSMYHNPEEGEVLDDSTTETQRPPLTDSTVLPQFQGYGLGYLGHDDSPGSFVLKKELYKLRQKPASQSGRTHHTWEVTRDEEEGEFDDEEAASPSGLPTIPDMNGGACGDRDRSLSPPLPPLPNEEHEAEDDYAVAHQTRNSNHDNQFQLPPWQKIHSRLLNWAIIWPMSEFDQALNSTTRGNQVDEVALSIWATQTYKRYVRARLTESPLGVDRLFVPPNIADVINNAVFNGRHGEACGMLKDLWAPFGFSGMPRLIIVLAKHRSDPNHWVVHRFSLLDGKLATYDTYQDRTLPDGRPLGWWFAIRIGWPNAPYPSPESLVQKMIRLHRPMQLGIDNSVAAAGIWRNLLMGSRAERSLDLERLRDLINTEVKNLRQRKQLGKLSIAVRPNWDQLAA